MMKKHFAILFLLFNSLNAVSQNINQPVLDSIIAEAKRSNSSSLAIFYYGKPIANEQFDTISKVKTQSITKSFINLAIGILIDKKLIKSVNEPISVFFPEWNEGMKSKITLLHLLNHTSGIEVTNNPFDSNKDGVAKALNSRIVSEPGKKFLYNNKAADLLSGIVEKVSGKKTDEFLKENLFAPLGIIDFEWEHDVVGHAYGKYGLSISAADLAKVGVMLEQGGVWEGRQIISSEWIKISSSSSDITAKSIRPCGLMWWVVKKDLTVIITDSIISSWRNAGMKTSIIRKIENLKNRQKTADEMDLLLRKELHKKKYVHFFKFIWKRNLKSCYITNYGKEIGFSGIGYCGQYLIIIPEKHLVGVRLISLNRSDRGFLDLTGIHEKTDFDNFKILIQKLVN